MEQPADESAIKRQPRPEEWIKRLLPKQKAIIIAIDFGTTFSGVAYSTEALAVSDKSVPLTELRELIRRVDVLRVWPEIDQSYQEKTATRLAYQDGKVLAWGGKVNDLRHKTIVEYFKLGLQENPAQLKTESLQLHAFACDTNWKHSELPDKTAEDYTADFMKQLYQWVRPKLPFAPKFLSSNQVGTSSLSPPCGETKQKMQQDERPCELACPWKTSISSQSLKQPQSIAQRCASKLTYKRETVL